MYRSHIQAPVIPGAQHGASQVSGPAVPMQVAGAGAYLPMQETDPMTSMFSMMMPMIMMVMVVAIMKPMLTGIGGS